jgi:Mg-chelatase subunit ChlD
MDKENLGPAEKILNAILTYSDHAVHNRPGFVSPDPTSVTGVKWVYVTHKVEDAKKVIYSLSKAGKKTVQTKVGVMGDDLQIRNDANRVVGRYQPAGIYPEVALWLYIQIAEVWKLDNEFAARWASYQYAQEHKDMKVVMAAFMLVQSRKGDPVTDEDKKILFFDEDFREVGETMVIHHGKHDKRVLSPKEILRIRDVLMLPQIAEVNRKLGFTQSARRPCLGRWEKAVHKWLEFREDNPKLLEGLMKGGWKGSVMRLAQLTHYKPKSNMFFRTMGWKQAQAKEGHRSIAIGETILSGAESWEGMTEAQICETIIKDRPAYLRITGLVPKNIGITRAVMAAAIEAGSLSDKALIIATPTIEELGLMEDPDVKKRWEKAMKNASDMRANNIAQRVTSKETKEKLEAAADIAVQKAIQEVSKNIRVYFFVDISGSMEGAIEAAKDNVAKFLQGFPEDKLHIATFNQIGREVKLKHHSAAGVKNAFQGIRAGGGTCHGEGVRALQAYKPGPDEDALFVFIGDEAEGGAVGQSNGFTAAVQASGLKPMAFGLVPVVTQHGRGNAVRKTATEIGIPQLRRSIETREGRLRHPGSRWLRPS